MDIYIDQFFLEQLVISYLLMKAGADLMGERIGRRGLFCAALLCSLITVILLCHRLPGWRIAGMTVASFFLFHGKKAADYLAAVIKLFFFSIFAGGMTRCIVFLFQAPVVLSALPGILGAKKMIEKLQGKQRILNRMEVLLRQGKKHITVYGILDTGNRLKEPLTGRAVSILDASAAQELLETDWEKKTGFLLIPFHSIGKECGFLRGTVIDEMEIVCERKHIKIQRPVIAVSGERISMSGQYQMILHPVHANIK